MTKHTIPLSFTRIPLNLNDRQHWAPKARITKQLRREAYIRCKAARIRPQPHITVTLHYQPRDRRKRDADNLSPTYKALCDGIVDAGLVNDDTPQYMTKVMPIIHPPVKGQQARFWMEITHP
ncbi:hypothetical protein ACEN2A_01780 [Corynebacterium auriscanis]|uniref:hypothetical protein n=1 Tax=Corynebacterium auriscanis TaxID=99807 RepID=UPI003CF2B388